MNPKLERNLIEYEYIHGIVLPSRRFLIELKELKDARIKAEDILSIYEQI